MVSSALRDRADLLVNSRCRLALPDLDEAGELRLLVEWLFTDMAPDAIRRFDVSSTTHQGRNHHLQDQDQ